MTVSDHFNRHDCNSLLGCQEDVQKLSQDSLPCMSIV